MKKKLFNPILALLMLFSFSATHTFGQCVSSFQSPSSTVNVSANVQTIVNSSMSPNRYAVINISVAGQYQVNTSFGTSLNITDNSNVSLASGTNPLDVTFPSPGLYRIHVCSSNSGGGRVVAISPKNRAFNFDGTDDIVSIGTNLTNAIGTSSVLTVEAWVKPSSLTGGGSIISNHNLNTSFCLRRSGDTYNAFIGFGTHGVTSAANTATLNVWQHVAMVFNSTSVSLYINGSLAGSTTFAPYNLPVNSVGNATCQIGNNGFNEAFQGDIDEVRVWKRALCQGEIQKKKDGIIPTTDNQLLANYHFEHGTVGGNNSGVTTLVDASGNNFNGTVTNAALVGTTSNWVQSAAYPANGAYPLVDVHPTYTPPAITISGANSICMGSSTTFTASGVSTYSWTSGPNTATYNVTPTITTTYSVVGTNSLGCLSNVATKVLTVNPNPTVTVNSGAIYAGQSFTMVPGGASTYTYSSGSSVVSPTTNTNYTVTGANVSGCTNTAVSSVSVNAEALNFDGSNDYISLASPITNDFTIEYWVKTSQTGLTGPQWYYGSGIVDAEVGGVTNDFGTALVGSKFSFGIGNPDISIMSTTNINDNNWHHVAATWVKNTGAMAIYVDGIAEGTAAGPINTRTATQINMGRLQTALRNFAGTIDEVRIWDVARTQCEINTYKNCEIPSTATNLLANFHFNQGYASSTNTVATLNDMSGNNNNGTLINFALSGSTSNWVAPGGVVSGYTTTANLTPTVGATISNSSICTGNSTTLSGTGADVYSWTGGVVNASAFTPTITNSYTVTGTNTLTGCSNISAVSVTVNPNPTVTVNSGAIYAGQSFTMVPGGASTYTYSSGSAVVSPTTQTSYTVTGANASGCTNTAVSTVSINAEAINFDGTNDIVSIGTNLTNAIGTSSVLTVEAWVKPSSLTGGGSIISNHNLNTSFCLRRSGDTYNAFIGFGTHGVTSAANTATLNVWQHVAMVFNSTSVSLYINGSLAGSTTFAPYNLPVNSVGNATCQIGNNGFNEAFQGDIDEARVWNRALCQGEIQNNMNGEIATTATGLLANYHFNQGIASAPNSTLTTLTDASGNNYNGTLTSFALTGSTSNWTSPGAVTPGSNAPVFVSPTVAITGTNTVCNGSSTTLTASGDVSTYAWVSGPNTATNSVSPSTQTTYSVVGTNSLGCVSNMAMYTVSVNALPTVTVSSGAICSGNSYTMVAGGASTYTYSSGADVVMPTAQTDYTVTGTDANGCENTAVSTVSVNTLPTVTVSSGSICSGNSYTMVAGGASTYTYSSGTDVVMPTAQTDYTVTGTDANGCENTAVSTVSVNALPTVTVSSGVVCAGSSYTMVAGGASTYTYSSGTDVVMPTAQTDYTVTGTDANGCENTAVSTVSINALPTVVAVTNNTLLCTGFTATLSASGANTYTWSTTENTSDIAVSPTVQTTYTVTGTDANGCENTTTITQDVDACTGIATVNNPNAISVYPNPNNGMFTIELTTQANVEVVNAIGQTLLTQTLEIGKSSLDIQNQADGIYFVKITTNNHQQIVKVIKK
jgi:hypothetical protein